MERASRSILSVEALELDLGGRKSELRPRHRLRDLKQRRDGGVQLQRCLAGTLDPKRGQTERQQPLELRQDAPKPRTHPLGQQIRSRLQSRLDQRAAPAQAAAQLLRPPLALTLRVRRNSHAKLVTAHAMRPSGVLHELAHERGAHDWRL